jgi:hypothetical protein
MTHKRLFLKDITDEHLTHMHRAAIVTPDGKTAQDWVREIAEGDLALFEIPNGIIGLKFQRKQVFIELFAGKRLVPSEVLAAVRELAKGKAVEGFVVDPKAVKVYERYGFKPVGTYMRLEANG